MKIDVKAQAFDRQTGEPVGKDRWETIDTNTNSLFREAHKIALDGKFPLMEVKERYESFWNNLNTQSEHVVFVQQIRQTKI